MDLHVRVAKLERANRRWKLLFAVVLGIWPVLLVAGGMSFKTTRNEGVSDEIRARALAVVDDEGNVVGTFDMNGLTMRKGQRVCTVGPSAIKVAAHGSSSVKISAHSIRVCGFDAEKHERYEDLLKQRLRDDLTAEERTKLYVELRKNDYEPPLVDIGFIGKGTTGIMRLSNVTGSRFKNITNRD